MSTELLIRGFFAAILSCCLMWRVFRQNEHELDPESDDKKSQRYAPYIPASLLPAALLLLSILNLLYCGPQETALLMLSYCFSTFFQITVFYAILLLLLPFLRKHISARACAMLWIIPNYLYVAHNNAMALPEPLAVFHAPDGIIWIILGVWLVGFATVLLWKIGSHLLFRFWILKDAVPVTDPAVLKLWQEEQVRAQLRRPEYRLVTSPKVKTPLSIGFLRSTIRVVLPEGNYTMEELRLIFRHEIIHISREDSSNKFFLVFCTAMCWFNPLMWLAMRRSADDLELSCDETVLLDADEETRRQYANLILTTAGDERGFTTCLSASVKALRYRLKNIIKPHNAESGGWGAIAIGLVFFLLCMTSGHVALAYDEAPGAEVIFKSEDLSSYTVSSTNYGSGRGRIYGECTDEAALNAYLAELHLSRITGNYTYNNTEHRFFILYNSPDGVIGVTLEDQIVTVAPLYEDAPPQTLYYLNSEIDWDYLESLIVETE